MLDISDVNVSAGLPAAEGEGPGQWRQGLESVSGEIGCAQGSSESPGVTLCSLSCQQLSAASFCPLASTPGWELPG